MANRDIVTIGASAGGVEAITSLVSNLPNDLSAAVFIVLHISSYSNFPKILNRKKHPLVSNFAQNGERINPGRIYVAPPDMHLILEPGVIRVARGPKENLSRPSIDVLFRSAANTYRNRVIGVVLSGTLDDGTAGLQAIKSNGGIAMVQDPHEAQFPDMPLNALRLVDVNYCLPILNISKEIVRLTSEELKDLKVVDQRTDQETQLSMADSKEIHGENRRGTPSVYSCPGCKGTLWEIQEENFVRYRCRVGHAYSPDSFLSEQKDNIEEALWTALTTLEERASLSRNLAEQARQNEYHEAAKMYEQRSKEAIEKAEVLRQLLVREETVEPVALEESQ